MYRFEDDCESLKVDLALRERTDAGSGNNDVRNERWLSHSESMAVHRLRDGDLGSEPFRTE